MSKRDEFVNSMKQKLDQWNSEIDALERRLGEAGASAKQGTSQRLQKLRSKRDEAQAKLDQVQSASADSWEALKGGVERTWDELKGALREAKDTFSGGLEKEGAGQR